jgi:cell division protein ZapA
MNQQTTSTTGANGQSTPHEIFALTDEQILEIEPEAQDVSVRDDVAQGDSPAGVSPTANATVQAEGQVQTGLAGLPVPLEPPAWLAETMNDPQRGAEARALWEGAQRAEKEAASYREVFAKPEDARAAAERARVLDDIDRAYFAGDATQRAQLAAMMMRENPAAFREMVFEGLHALEAAEQPGNVRSVASAVGATLASSTAHGNGSQPGGASLALTAQPSSQPQQHDDSAQQTQLAAYAMFEKAANDDLERSVGSAIERTLAQALPSLTSAGGPSGVVAQHAAPLQARCDIFGRAVTDSMSAPVKVEIFGQMYAIRGDLDEAYVHKLGQYVDEKMQAIALATATVDTQKVAVLAALAIADELHSIQKDRGDREELMREQAERCLTLVERALKQTA